MSLKYEPASGPLHISVVVLTLSVGCDVFRHGRAPSPIPGPTLECFIVFSTKRCLFNQFRFKMIRWAGWAKGFQ